MQLPVLQAIPWLAEASACQHEVPIDLHMLARCLAGCCSQCCALVLLLLLHPAGLSTTMEVLGEDRQRPVQKAKMEIMLRKSEDFHKIIAEEAAAEAERKAERAAAEQHDS
jgi:hypothetical protein